jgi:hypothetical protein
MKIAYIAGCTHSGSTLMNRVLGAHPDAVTLGSVKRFDKVMHEQLECCCGAPNLLECPFWSKIDVELKRQGRSLNNLCLRTRNNSCFEEDNLALFSAIQKATGAKVIVDSSRRSSRQQRLARISELEVVPVHLYKTPLAQAGSWKKKGRNLAQFVSDYWARNARILNAGRNDPRAVMLSYEYFCENPKSELSRLFSAFGLDVNPEVLKGWGAQPIHTLGGNRMKFNTSSEIYLDEGWRKALSPIEVKVMQSTCGVLWRTMRKRQFG